MFVYGFVYCFVSVCVVGCFDIVVIMFLCFCFFIFEECGCYVEGFFGSFEVGR